MSSVLSRMLAFAVLAGRRDPEVVEGPFLPADDGSLSPYQGRHRAEDRTVVLAVSRSVPFAVEQKAGADMAPATAGGEPR